MKWIYILMKFFYFFFAVKVMQEKTVFSFNYNFIWRTVYTIYFRDLDFCLLHMKCMLGFFWLSIFLKLLASPEDISNLLLKCCVVHLNYSDDENSPQSCQWCSHVTLLSKNLWYKLHESWLFCITGGNQLKISHSFVTQFLIWWSGCVIWGTCQVNILSIKINIPLL
jgi:hypothetical protein